MAKLSEKIGYGMGDMASSMFWKIFSYYLPIFYSDIFNLTPDGVSTVLTYCGSRCLSPSVVYCCSPHPILTSMDASSMLTSHTF